MTNPAEEAVISLLEEAFPDAKFSLGSRDNDGVHYSLEIYTDAFIEKSILQQHRMVFNVLRGVVGESLHALSLKTGVLRDAEHRGYFK